MKQKAGIILLLSVNNSTTHQRRIQGFGRKQTSRQVGGSCGPFAVLIPALYINMQRNKQHRLCKNFEVSSCSKVILKVTKKITVKMPLITQIRVAWTNPCATCLDGTYSPGQGPRCGTSLSQTRWTSSPSPASITSKPFTRNQRASSLSEQNKSPLTDHASHDNHVINWPASTILDRESDKSTRWSKRQYIFEKDGNLWTGTRGATRWATRTTDFLPRRITIVARTRRGIEQTSSDERLW